MDIINKVFTKLRFLFLVGEQCQKISIFLKQSCLMIVVNSEWLRKKSDEVAYAASAKAVVFNI